MRNLIGKRIVANAEGVMMINRVNTGTKYGSYTGTIVEDEGRDLLVVIDELGIDTLSDNGNISDRPNLVWLNESMFDVIETYNRELTTISDYADDEIAHVIHMYTDDPDGGMYSVTVEDAHRTPSVHLFNKEEYTEFMKGKIMENLIGKNVQILGEGIKEINRINKSGVDNDLYTGQIVGGCQ